MAKSILLICKDPADLAKRKATLEDAGFSVTAATEEDEALKLLSDSGYDAVILANTISDDERNQLNRRLKRAKPETPVVVIMNQGEHDGLADAVVTNPKNPHALLETVMGVFAAHSAER
jgi:DNA-binding NtrC family response regulator